MERRQALIVYYALAVLPALLIAVTRQPSIPFFVLILACGLVASYVRSSWLNARAWSRFDLSWGLVFLATLLPIAWLSRNWPFG